MPFTPEEEARHRACHEAFRARTITYEVRIDGDYNALRDALMATGRDFEISVHHPRLFQAVNEAWMQDATS